MAHVGSSLRQIVHRAQIAVLRLAPLPWRWKYWLVWAASARFAVGIAVVVADDQGRILTLASAYSPEPQLPGGLMTYGESTEQAIRREVREELGLDLAALRLVAVVFVRRQRQVQLLFRGTLPSGSIRLSPEHRAWAFVPRDHLPHGLRRWVDLALDDTAAGGVHVLG